MKQRSARRWRRGPLGLGAGRESRESPESRLHPDDVRRLALRGVAAVAMRGVLARVIAFVGTLALARLLGPSDFGVIAFGLTITTTGRFLTDAGIGPSLIRREAPPTKRELQLVLGFQLGGTAAGVLALALLAAQLGDAVSVAAIMAASLLIDAFRTPASIVVQRELNFGPLAMAEVAGNLAFYGSAVAAVAAGLGVAGVAGAASLRALTSTVILLAATRLVVVRPRISIAGLRGLIGFGVKYQAAEGLTVVRDQGANILAAAVGGVATLGVWSLCYRLLGAAYLVFQAVWQVSFSAMARLTHAGEELGPVLHRTLRRMSVVTGMILVPLVGTAPVAVPTLFGREWDDVLQVMPSAGVGFLLLGPISAAAAGYLYAIGEAGTVLRALAIDVLLFFLVAFPLLPTFGVMMIGLGVLVAFSAQGWVLARALRQRLGIPFARAYFVPIGISLAAGTVLWSISAGLSEGVPSIVAAALGGEFLLIVALIAVDREAIWDVARTSMRMLRHA